MADPLKSNDFWRPKPDECDALKQHLLAELPLGHVLDAHRDSFTVEARDRDGNRLIVAYGDGKRGVVQMTWAGRPAMAPFIPETDSYDSEAEMLAALSKD